MPKRKYVKSRSRKRTFKRRRRSRRSALTRLPGMLGKTFKQKFRYVEQITLNPTIGTPATYSFRLNDLYDPNYTGVGHQPIGFDQVMNFYNHFTVIGAKIKATFVSNGTSAGLDTYVVGIETSGSATPTTALNDIYEQGMSSWGVMTNAASTGKKIITRGCNVSKFLGQKVMQEDANAGTVSASPAELVYFHLFAAGINTGNDPTEFNVIIELDQIAVLHEPKKLAGS